MSAHPLLIGLALLAALQPQRGRDPQSPPEKPPAGRPAGGRGAPAPTDLSASYFESADMDGDGWIKFSEAAETMQTDRLAFQAFDTDRDGLISPAEFGARYVAIVSRGGVFRAPRGKAQTTTTWKDAGDLLSDMDANEDRALDENEIGHAIKEAGVRSHTALELLEALDADKSQLLEPGEVEELYLVLKPGATRAPAARAKSFAELFDVPIERELRGRATIGPPRVRGPISPFRRLDLDRDGSISLEDLEQLSRPHFGVVRPAAVLATLDLDGDGLLAPGEFDAAFRSPMVKKEAAVAPANAPANPNPPTNPPTDGTGGG